MNVRTIACLSILCTVLTACQKRNELDDALRNARTTGKSLMVEFGADWCSDCQALSREVQQEPLNTCMQKNVSVFKVDVGQFNKNLDVASRLGIDIKNGVIPTAIFFPPTTAARTTQVGITKILSFLKQSCPDGIE